MRQRAKIYVCLVHSCVEKFKKHKYTHLCLSSLMKKLAGKERRRESQQKKVVYQQAHGDMATCVTHKDHIVFRIIILLQPHELSLTQDVVTTS